MRLMNGILMGYIVFLKELNHMKYMKSQMKQLVKENKDLQSRLKELMAENDLEKNFALKALYHAEVAEGGKYQLAYQALDLPKR